MGWKAKAKAVAWLPLVIAAFSGCVKSADPSLDHGPQGTSILVEAEDGSRFDVTVTNETGALVGRVTDDAGFALAGTHVALLGRDETTQTNKSGEFKFEGLPPGEYTLRVARTSYRAVEAVVAVTAANATAVRITLLPLEGVGAGYRPHAHDYWAGRGEVVVADHSQEFYRHPEGRLGPVSRIANQVLGLRKDPCVDSAGYARGVSYFLFDDPSQTVWPGTAGIAVTVQWTASDYVGSDKVGLVWKSANATKFQWGRAIRSGETFEIKVEPAMWDNGHQAFTLWQFGLCVAGSDEGYSSWIPGILGRAFVGKFHVKMALKKGFDLGTDPPHPNFWTNGTRILALDAMRTITCTTAIEVCSTAAWSPRPDLPERYFLFRPTGLIPPGTKRIEAYLNWTANVDAALRPLGMSYSPASIPPSSKYLLTGYTPLRATAATSGSRIFEFEVPPAQVDSYYQTKSNWVFMWGWEGEETSDAFLYSCGCDLKIRLQVYALGEAPDESLS